MSSIGEVLAGVRKAILVDHRLAELAIKMDAIDLRERDTRDRVMRLEGILQGAQAATKRLR